MKDLLSALQALQGTPVPNLLVIGGFILLILAFAGKVGAVVELPPKRQKWAGIIGVLLLILGIVLFMLPEFPLNSTPAQEQTQPSLETTGCIPTLLLPEAGAVLDNGRTDSNDNIERFFDWSDCPGATAYHLIVARPRMDPEMDNNTIPTSSFDYAIPGTYVADENRFGWTWKVRANVNGQWGPWSEARPFEIEPVNTDLPIP